MKLFDENIAQEKRVETIKTLPSTQHRREIDNYANYFSDALSEIIPITKQVRNFVKDTFSSFVSPDSFQRKLNSVFNCLGWRVVISGTIEDRVAFLLNSIGETYIYSFGAAIDEVFTDDEIIELSINSPRKYLSKADVSPKYLKKLEDTNVMLISLYHPEIFPLCRFPLGISDLAYALRKRFMCKVELYDMQLGTSLSEFIKKVIIIKPQLIGISATFGQNDILDQAIDELNDLPEHYKPYVVFGGSLPVLNIEHIFNRFPRALIGLGPGEHTLRDIIKWTRNEIRKEDICGVAYKDDKGCIVKTKNINNRYADNIIPELDLLPDILDNYGVMQLESSRGCSYSCSFCPREHKGIWSGEAANATSTIIKHISNEFDNHPLLSRKIFLVDEEFFGYHSLSNTRVLGVSDNLSKYGFSFETSSRIDQVYRPNKEIEWHVQRIDTWRKLSNTNLSRCLFGVESGVDSILNRFNKKTTSKQNIVSIRMLSLIGTPTRFTYITFDPLMTFDELVETFTFLGRTDLILKKSALLSSEQIYRLSQDDLYANKNSLMNPFYRSVSYMLVSMECLVNSKYTTMVNAKKLIKGHNLQMGKEIVEYENSIIGLYSKYCQLWIDHNFSLDYLFKSLQKISSLEVSNKIHTLRVILKDYSYHLLGEMIRLEIDIHYKEIIRIKSRKKIELLKRKWILSSNKDSALLLLLKLFKNELKETIFDSYCKIKPYLSSINAEMIEQEIEKWSNNTNWRFING